MLHDLILFIAGIIVGIMNAIAGGGMLIGFPIMLALGIPALVANVTSNLVVLPGNISATYSYRRYLRKVPRQYLLLLIPASIGAAFGAILLKHTSFSSFNHVIPWLILFAVILFTFQPFLYKLVNNHLHGSKRSRSSNKPLIIVGVAILPLSVYGGYFGAGLGFIMLAFLGFTRLHDHIHRINALKTTITVCIASVSLICLLNSHLFNWRVGVIMGAGNFIGGFYGANATQKVSSHVLRIAIVIIGFSTASVLSLHSF